MSETEDLSYLKDPQFWRAKYNDRVRVIHEWHEKAVALGYDGVTDLLDAVERGEPPIHIARMLARAAGKKP